MNLRKFAAAPLAAIMFLTGVQTLPASAASKTSVQIKTVNAKKVSSKKIKLTWSDAKDNLIKTYSLQRYDSSRKKWVTLKNFSSNGKKGDKPYSYTDTLKSSSPQRYKYRVNVKVRNTSKYKAVSGKANYGSNIKVCIDPGHYLSLNKGSYSYSEAAAVLKIGTQLKSYLKSYGIDSVMTRSDKNITVGGLYNSDNSTQLNARGHAAKANNCDLFVSLHTNANGYNANGRSTADQSSAINKTIVFVNRTAYTQNSKTALKTADLIGRYITAVNKKVGISTNSFCPISKSKGTAIYYHTTASNPTTANDAYTKYNDSLNKPGSVIYRTQANGTDYYAVLRAAASDGVPGILIEHAYHTYPGFCRKFMNDPKVAKYYALYDTKSILEGYGFDS